MKPDKVESVSGTTLGELLRAKIHQMEANQELLELAAKAMQKLQHPDFANYTVMDGCVCLELGNSRGAITTYWKPLTDDGDALRLAVKLEIRLDIGTTMVAAYPFKHDAVVEYSEDMYAATRRAIVCAAAEIGRSMV